MVWIWVTGNPYSNCIYITEVCYYISVLLRKSECPEVAVWLVFEKQYQRSRFYPILHSVILIVLVLPSAGFFQSGKKF